MAKDVITRFKLETTGFDSKIKQAAKDLSAYSKTATQAKEGFNQFTKANIDAAKALGTMATSTTNVKDRVKELVGAYNAAAKAYEELSDEHKQSDFAKALAGSLTQLQQRIKETKEEMQGLSNTMKGDAKGGIFDALGGKMSGALAVFGGNMMTAAAGAVANLGAEMADMVKQGIEMAKAGEGVRIAFERLGRGDILNGLREATHGTVTDLELMKAAVKFNDFKLPVEELGTMLAFAQQKAKDTGQSIDYMVDSIVTGLGRKSLMILDNLGLSAAEIREKMKQTGDMTKAVGAIIREQMESAGDYVETAADRAAQANVSLQNKMEELGRKYAPLQEASNTFWTSVKISILDIVGGPLADFLEGLTEAGRKMNMLKNMKGGDNGNPSKVDRQLSELRGSNYKEQKYNSQLQKYDHEIKVAEFLKKKYQNAGMGGGAVLGEVSRRFNVKVFSEEDIDNIIDSLRNMRSEYEKGAKEIMKPTKVDIDTTKAVKNVGELQKKLKDLERQRRQAVKAGDQEQVELLTKQINEVKQNIGYLDPNALKTTTKKDLDELQKIQKKIADLTKEAYTADGERLNTIQKEIEGLQEQESKLLKIKDLVTGKGPDLDKLFPDNSAKNYNTGYQGSAQAKVDSATVDMAMGPLNIDSVNAYIATMKSALKDADFGSDLYNSLTEKLSDASTMTAALQQAMTSGVSGVDLTSVAEEMKQKLLEGDISEDAWQEFLDKLNEKIEDADLKLTFDVDSKKIETVAKKQQKDAQAMAKDWQAAGTAINAVGQAMSQIEDPAAKVLGTIAQAVATMALSYSQAAASPAVTSTGWGWIAFAATGVATMLSSIAAIKNATSGFASGGVIPGNSYSGDNMRGITPDGNVYGLNAGEVVLNRAQQGNLAAQLERSNAGSGVESQPFITGELLYLGLNNYLRRSGRGEIITSR